MSFLRQIVPVLCVVSIVGLSGCGQKIKDSIVPVNTSSIHNGANEQIVILPFADYSVGRHTDDALRRQVKIQEALAYRLAQRGFLVPVEEDVVQYLADIGVIRIVKASTESNRPYADLKREIGAGWSPEMESEIRALLIQNRGLNESETRMEITKVGLDRGIIQQIGRYFGANYVLRGRIVEYEIRNNQALSPIQQGILPFFFDSASGFLFGFADSGRYDLWQDMAVGGGLGALFGSSANTPFNAPGKRRVVSGHPMFGISHTVEKGGYSNSNGLNAAVWGGAGAAAAYLASKGGNVPQAVIQLSLALQDVHTGKVVWENRVEKRVEPESAWADPSERLHMDTAVEEAARVLADNLMASFRSTVSHGAPPVVSSGSTGPGAVGKAPGKTLPTANPPEPAPESPETWGS